MGILGSVFDSFFDGLAIDILKKAITRTQNLKRHKKGNL